MVYQMHSQSGAELMESLAPQSYTGDPRCQFGRFDLSTSQTVHLTERRGTSCLAAEYCTLKRVLLRE